jgi:DNA-binding transcriptional ArsR family regulator
MTRPPPPSFVRLLDMLNAIRQLSPFDTLNADEGLLLDALIVKWHERDNIMVSEVMSDARFGSHPTAYRRIISLRDKGLVCLRIDSKDKRSLRNSREITWRAFVKASRPLSGHRKLYEGTVEGCVGVGSTCSRLIARVVWLGFSK